MNASQSGVKKDALGISGTANNNAQGALSTINPIYSQMATAPTGYTAQQRGDMLTSSSQALGGGLASAVGQGSLLAARTNNAGGEAAALDAAARGAGQQQSANALDVANQNTQLQLQQKQQGLAGLNGIYNSGQGASIAALNTANNTQQPFWKQFLQQGLAAGSGAADAYLGRPA